MKTTNKMNLTDEMTKVIDDEECKVINELKEFRTHYKGTIENLKLNFWK